MQSIEGIVAQNKHVNSIRIQENARRQNGVKFSSPAAKSVYEAHQPIAKRIKGNGPKTVVVQGRSVTV